MLRFLGLFKNEIAETVEMLYEWVNPYVVDTSKSQSAFGLQPTPLAEAVRETVEWCRSQSAVNSKQ